MTTATGKVRWCVILCMFLIAAVSFLDRNNISIAVVAIQKQFVLSDIQIGFVFTAFITGYAASQPFAGWLADRFGPYRVIAIGILWWSLFTAMTAIVPAGLSWSLAGLMAVRLMLGLGEAVIFPASNRLVVNWMPSAERGLANGIIFAGVGMGAGVAPPLIGHILAVQSWQWAFYYSALIGLAALVVWLTVARDRPDKHPWVGDAERRAIDADRGVQQDAQPIRWSTLLRNRSLACLSASYFAFGYVAYIFFTWFFKYLAQVRALDPKSLATFAMLPFMAMAAASPIGGWIADRIARGVGIRAGRCLLPAAVMAIAGLCIGFAPQAADARSAALFLAGGAGALYLSQSAFWTSSANLAGRAAGSASGLMNMANQIGGIVTSLLTPYVALHIGWTASFGVAALICFAGATAWLLVDPNQRLESEAPPS